MNSDKKCIRITLFFMLLTALSTADTAWSAEAQAQREVLSAENVFGNAKIGYLAAKKIPDICAKLFCYCGCDLTDNHASLLDCYTSDHGMDCNICQEEAIMAMKMRDQGKSLPEIQKAVDQKFVAEYNSVFETPSAALLKYRQQRLWKPTASELSTENTIGRKKDNNNNNEKNGETGKSLEGKASDPTPTGRSNTPGSCCGHDK